VANVAKGILHYIHGELPSYRMQMRFRCFSLDGSSRGGSSPSNDLKQLLRAMAWEQGEIDACVAEFEAALPAARAVAAASPGGLLSRDAWASVVKSRSGDSLLKRVVGTMLGFLVSETSCERNFALERRQYDKRPKLGVDSRANGIKAPENHDQMVDTEVSSLEGAKHMDTIIGEQQVAKFGAT
jgi:hypothetical protein